MSKFKFSETTSKKELLDNKEFKILLEKGEPVVYHVGKPKKNTKDGKIYFSLHVAQFRELVENKFKDLFQDWDFRELVICYKNIEYGQLQNLQVSAFCIAGAVLNDITILVKDNLKPKSEFQKPRMTIIKDNNGVEDEYIYTFEGKHIYRNMELAYNSDGKKDEVIIPNGREKINYLNNHQNLKSNTTFDYLPIWFRRASTKNASLLFHNHHFIWEHGIWLSGTWENGVWQNGTWENGTWKNGIWQNGSWKNGVWKDGIWKDGTWENGVWQNGVRRDFELNKSYGLNADELFEIREEIMEEMERRNADEWFNDISLQNNDKSQNKTNTDSQNYGEAFDFE